MPRYAPPLKRPTLEGTDRKLRRMSELARGSNFTKLLAEIKEAARQATGRRYIYVYPYGWEKVRKVVIRERRVPSETWPPYRTERETTIGYGTPRAVEALEVPPPTLDRASARTIPELEGVLAAWAEESGGPVDAVASVAERTVVHCSLYQVGAHGLYFLEDRSMHLVHGPPSPFWYGFNRLVTVLALVGLIVTWLVFELFM
ncbi:MAG: hypothetical protein NZ898_16170 [Myxococcota bacterium]|nr:hypothetical protein [Myxococcota bacterium]